MIPVAPAMHVSSCRLGYTDQQSLCPDVLKIFFPDVLRRLLKGIGDHICRTTDRDRLQAGHGYHI